MKTRLLPVLLLLSCKPAPPSSPEAAYRAFVAHAHALHEGKLEKELLADFDASTRALLQARAAASAHATAETLPGEPAYQLTLGGAEAPAVTEIQLQSSSAQQALLRVVLDGGASATVKMVNEEGRWRVHLDALP